jgi:SAM-dependent methyltransferase
MRIMLDCIALKFLRLVYGFHSWHADSPLSARPYRHTVAAMINDLHPKCVVEVGCGLGSILSLVRAQERIGYDLDAGVIKAARLIRDRKIQFEQGDLTDVSQNRIDVLILVNWIHEVSPEQLADLLIPLYSRTSFLCLDAIDQDNASGYSYMHDFSFLKKRVRLLNEARVKNEGRRFLIYEVLK